VPRLTYAAHDGPGSTQPGRIQDSFFLTRYQIVALVISLDILRTEGLV
jgi:hypothetical protein